MKGGGAPMTAGSRTAWKSSLRKRQLSLKDKKELTQHRPDAEPWKHSQSEGTGSARALGFSGRRRWQETKPEEQAAATPRGAFQAAEKILDFVLKTTDAEEGF